jgi:hypothetical protein
MNKTKAVLIACGAAAVLYLGTSAVPAVAQAVRATLTRSVDEPGRNPYESTVFFNVLVNGIVRNPCLPSFCAVQFAQVPQDRRLVLQNLTGLIRVSNRSLRFLSLAGDAGNAPHLSVFPIAEQNYTSDIGPFSTDVYLLNLPVSGYVEGGQNPVFSMVGVDSFLSVGRPSQIKLTGYLVDLTQ